MLLCNMDQKCYACIIEDNGSVHRTETLDSLCNGVCVCVIEWQQRIEIFIIFFCNKVKSDYILQVQI